MNAWAPRGIVSAQEWHLERVLRPVVGVDIDGTLGDWHQTFLHFAEQYLQKQVRWDWDGTEPFWTMLGVHKRLYRQVKLAFRQSGLKRAMPLLPYAQEFVQGLRAEGAELWVCTTRPYLRLDNIDPDTRWWLWHHGLRYDGVLFGEQKYRDLHHLFGARVVAILDDLPEQVERATARGMPAWLVQRSYNKHAVVRGVPHVHGLAHGADTFTAVLRQWKKEHRVR